MAQPRYRIGIDARFFRTSTGGIGRYTRELIEGLARLDPENDYFVLLTPADRDEWTLQQANFTPVVVDAPHYSRAEQTTLLKSLNAHRLDLVHFLNFNHPLFYRRPFVTTLHDLTILHFPVATRSGKGSGIKFMMFKRVLEHALRGARRVIAISKHSAADAQATLGIPPAKISVVYEGHPETQVLPEDSEMRLRAFLGTDQPYFLFVSMWRGHKGILTLLEAFAEFKRASGLPHQLVMAGKADAAPAEVRAAIDQHPFRTDVVTPGFVPDELLSALYTHADAFVMPSEYEGFGLPVLEALSYGTPTIVANNSSLPEVGGDAVLYFPTRDAGALAARMHEIVADEELRARLSAAMPAQLAKFSWDRCAAETLQVYRDVLSRTK
ncbi:MAG: glycosyltransferase family 4 protein [Methanoregulaceae archaeon]|nr:glycosyltransferase family 4 protein [Methanoregulaceae archaeon]